MAHRQAKRRIRKGNIQIYMNINMTSESRGKYRVDLCRSIVVIWGGERIGVKCDRTTDTVRNTRMKGGIRWT